LLQPIQDLLILRRREFHVINLSRDGVRSAPDDSFDEDFVGNIEEDEAVSGDTGGGEGVRLSRCTWKAV
jgi:hypothetical protein